MTKMKTEDSAVEVIKYVIEIDRTLGGTISSEEAANLAMSALIKAGYHITRNDLTTGDEDQ